MLTALACACDKWSGIVRWTYGHTSFHFRRIPDSTGSVACTWSSHHGGTLSCSWSCSRRAHTHAHANTNTQVFFPSKIPTALCLFLLPLDNDKAKVRANICTSRGKYNPDLGLFENSGLYLGQNLCPFGGFLHLTENKVTQRDAKDLNADGLSTELWCQQQLHFSDGSLNKTVATCY